MKNITVVTGKRVNPGAGDELEEPVKYCMGDALVGKHINAKEKCVDQKMLISLFFYFYLADKPRIHVLMFFCIF